MPPKQLKQIIKLYIENESNYKNKNKIKSPSILGNDKSNIWMYSKVISEIILQSYLIHIGIRDVAEIKIASNVIDAVKEYLDSNDIGLHIRIKEETTMKLPKKIVYYMYLSKHELDINNDDLDNRGVAIADKLGDFYNCKSKSEEWKKYEWRILIDCDGSEIFAQMCKPEQIEKNIKNTMDIYAKILEAFKKLDNKRFSATPPPLKLSIYKTKVTE